MIRIFIRRLYALFDVIIIPYCLLLNILIKVIYRGKKNKIGILNLEYFHKNAGGFGGFGKSAKNITDHFNNNGRFFEAEILLPISKRTTIVNIHNTDVIMGPSASSYNIIHELKYLHMINMSNFDVLITMEYYKTYERSIIYLTRTPVIIWIHDPRPYEYCRRITTVSLEVKCGGIDAQHLKEREIRIRESIQKVIKLSKLFKRKVVFATTAKCLIERAKKLYDIDDIESIVLPTPVDIPQINNINHSSRPSILFLGRLDPVKRPWIFFELAKLFSGVDFIVAGITHFPEIMNPVISGYTSIPNLKFLGLVDDKGKDVLLKNVWAIVNTSVHEALPVSFLESFAYGKPVISCQNPDNFVENFGYYTGEILGDGFDSATVGIFTDALHKLFNNNEERLEKGKAAREFIKSNYSFKSFENALQNIIKNF